MSDSEYLVLASGYLSGLLLGWLFLALLLKRLRITVFRIKMSTVDEVGYWGAYLLIEVIIAPWLVVRHGWLVAAAALLGVYVFTCWRRFSIPKASAPETSLPVPERPRVPQIALVELIVIVLSTACIPLALEALYQTPFSQLYVLVAALTVIFPIAQVRLLRALHVCDVASGPLRLSLLFLFPFFVYAMLFTFARGSLFLASWLDGTLARLEPSMPLLPQRLAATTVVTALGIWLILHATWPRAPKLSTSQAAESGASEP